MHIVIYSFGTNFSFDFNNFPSCCFIFNIVNTELFVVALNKSQKCTIPSIESKSIELNK